MAFAVAEKGKRMSDYISREDAVKAIESYYKERSQRSRSDEMFWVKVTEGSICYDMINTMSSLPSAQPELIEQAAYIRGFEQGRTQGMIDAQPNRKKGKWICWYEEIENDTCTEYIPHSKCSECGTEYDSHTIKFINFCNYCGADMRKGE